MKILGISGSPRKGGIIDSLLDSALEGSRAAGGIVEKIILNDLDLRPCQDCGDGTETGRCAIQDDMQLIYDKFGSSERFILASPVYFGSISAQLKTMIDRFQTAYVAKYVLKKAPVYATKRKGLFLCVGGQDKREYFDNSRQIIKIFFTTLDIEYSGEFFLGGYNTKAGDVEERRRARERAFQLGKALAENDA